MADSGPPEGFIRATHGGPYAVDLGPFYSRAEDGAWTLAIPVAPRHCNSAGAAHGGFVASLADLGLIHAVAQARLAQGIPRTGLTTVTLSVDYIGPAPEGSWLTIRSTVSKLGRSLCFAEGVMEAAGRRVARASGVFAVLAPRG
jgi:uncharacterized protein (TIGR00369 family)